MARQGRSLLKWGFLAATHAAMLGAGFAAGVYALPIITAPDGPSAAALDAAAAEATFTGVFERDLAGSDFLHWGEGEVMISETTIAHRGALAPGPDYNVYLVEDFVETEEAFLAIKDEAALIGPVSTFDGFVLEIPEGVDPADYAVVVVWCEAFEEFITAAVYR